MKLCNLYKSLMPLFEGVYPHWIMNLNLFENLIVIRMCLVEYMIGSHKNIRQEISLIIRYGIPFFPSVGLCPKNHIFGQISPITVYKPVYLLMCFYKIPEFFWPMILQEVHISTRLKHFLRMKCQDLSPLK